MIRSKPSNDKYRKNYDRIFMACKKGKKRKGK